MSRYVLDFTIPGLPKAQVAGSGGHWRTRHEEAKRWEVRVKAIVLGDHYLPEKPLKRARVLFERHSSQPIDSTNLRASFKAIEDALHCRPRGKRVGLPVLEDDKAENYEGGEPEVRWVKAKRGEGFVRIRVEEVTPERVPRGTGEAA
jgi:hypothetical protein